MKREVPNACIWTEIVGLPFGVQSQAWRWGQDSQTQRSEMDDF